MLLSPLTSPPSWVQEGNPKSTEQSHCLCQSWQELGLQAITKRPVSPERPGVGRKVQSCWALSARNPSDIFIANAASGDGEEKCLDASNITMGLEVVAGERRKEVAAEGIEVGC